MKTLYTTLSAHINTGASAQSKQQAAHANCTAIFEPISSTSFYHPPPIDNKILIELIVNNAGGGAQLSSFVPSSFERLVTATWSLNFVRATKLLATHPDRAQLTVASDRTASHSRSPPKLLRSCYEAPANIKPEVLSSESTNRR